MIFNKPKFWDKKFSIISIILLPITFLTILLIFFKKKFTFTKVFKIPIICVGNIYVGGTGKTPVSIFLANEISKLGKKAVILRKYYKSHNDEHELIKKKFNNLLLKRDRIEGLKEIEKSGFNLAILDDGLQDYSIKKDLNIVCFHNSQLIGNGLVMPSGPLRENLVTLKNVEIALINGGRNVEFENKILKINKKLKIFYTNYKAENIADFKNKNLVALAAIGNPENFFQLLEQNRLKIKKKLIYPDHYIFSKNEVKSILDTAEKNNAELIMTEKDYFKFKFLNSKKLNYLKVSLEIKEKENFLKIIKNII